MTVLPSGDACKKLSKDQFDALVDTLLHEAMHSTDSKLQAEWDGYMKNLFGYVTANHRAIGARVVYETMGVTIGSEWGTRGTSHAQALHELYDSTR